LLANAPANVAALFAEYKSAKSALAKVEQQLSSLGYYVSDYHETKLRIGSNTPPKELVAFDAETSRIDKRISDLKRDYTLRLFAGGEEAKELFATLANEIANIAG
jgi:hypothetical protein